MARLTVKTLNRAIKQDEFFKNYEVERQTLDQQSWAMIYCNNGSWTRSYYKYKFDNKYFPNLNKVYAYIFNKDFSE